MDLRLEFPCRHRNTYPCVRHLAPRFSDEEDADLARYIDVLGSMIRITRDWTLGSARYAEQDELVRLAG